MNNKFKEDALKAVQAVSDRIVTLDLKNSDKTITITGISFFEDSQTKKDATITRTRMKLHYQNDDGKPYIPCVTLNEFIYEYWGVPENPSSYNGRKITLFADPNVKVGSDVTGGVRIKAMSHINKPIHEKRKRGRAIMTIAVQPIIEQPTKAEPTAEQKEAAAEKAKINLLNNIEIISEIEHVAMFLQSEANQSVLKRLQDGYPDKHTEVMTALQNKENQFKE